MDHFYCVVDTAFKNPDDKISVQLLEKACRKKGSQFHQIDSQDFDFANPPQLEPGASLYKVSIDRISSLAFRLVVREDIATVFDDLFVAVSQRITSALTHQKFRLPVIPTIFNLPRDRKLLKEYAQKLGGFPLIIKAVGGSHGVGVMRADSFESLASIADYLASMENQFILRKYIHFKQHARLIVLGNQVIDSVIYEKPDDDFRTNVSDIKVTPHKFSIETEKIAVDATRVLRSDFGGVDILINNHETSLLAEVNVPCFFARAQMATGVDTAGQLVEFLKVKGTKLAKAYTD